MVGVHEFAGFSPNFPAEGVQVNRQGSSSRGLMMLR